MAGIGYSSSGGAPLAVGAPSRDAPRRQSPGYGGVLAAFGGAGGAGNGLGVKQGTSNPFYGDKNGANYKTWEANHGAGASAPASAAPEGGGGTTNTSTANPGIGWANDKLKGLYEGGGNVDALSRQAAGSIRDDAENLRKGARDSAAMRGVSGGGVEAIANSTIDREVLQAQGKARVGIANDWEARKQGILRDVAGNSATDENLQNQQRNTGINQASFDFQRANAARQAERDYFQDLFNLAGSFGLFGNA